MQKIPNGTKVKITDMSKHSYGQIGIIYDYSMPPFYDFPAGKPTISIVG